MTVESGMRVLIVEDEWIVAEDHASVLRDAGYEVVGPASTVETSLDLINSEPINAAILDISLSREDSYPVVDRLEELGVPYVFLSGYLAEDLPEGFRDRPLLSKPAVPEEMLAAVRKLIAAADPSAG
ncbi:CheY-like chemotaxis protein [Hoeflea marina]|uniref:CheY-like chemotaxis protein n=1 Tax=Hoeflea marina TaxID=274592 RepID=A0A317PHE6_9HYPH|nr:response regulator [Hoeflea marina]PWV99841.1 CheY-like chemotaxis protein [Hoeflea marina]